MIEEIRGYKGSVALTTVIVLSGILIAAAATLTLVTIDLRQGTALSIDYTEAQIHIDTCIEESVQRLKYLPTFTGEITVDFDNGSCRSTISDGAQPGIKLVEMESSSGEAMYMKSISVDTTDYPFEVIY
jgi:hypothetical protein